MAMHFHRYIHYSLTFIMYSRGDPVMFLLAWPGNRHSRFCLKYLTVIVQTAMKCGTQISCSPEGVCSYFDPLTVHLLPPGLILCFMTTFIQIASRSMLFCKLKWWPWQTYLLNISMLALWACWHIIAKIYLRAPSLCPNAATLHTPHSTAWL